MELSKSRIETQNGPIREPEAQYLLRNPIDAFTEQFSQGIDNAVNIFLTERVGDGWEMSKVSVVYVPNADSTRQGYRYHIIYDGQYIGTMMTVVAVQETKAIGNIYFELEDRSETKGTEQKTV